MAEREQALLAHILDLFAERFHKRAILRGGMVLRLLGCPRLTNDLDYVFVPFKSKGDIVDDVVGALRTIPGSEVAHSLNSKCLRAVVTVEGISVQVEAKVAMAERTTVLSTREMASTHGRPTRLVSVVDYPVALAHKMAAWNERRLVRDLYDIWFYLRMGVTPDESVLAERLRTPVYSRLVPPAKRFSGGGVRQFFDFLRFHAAQLTDREVAGSLSDYLPPEEWVGLAMAIRAELAKLKG
jgi:predicted nucleotidyltransferase component of viral defense system